MNYSIVIDIDRGLLRLTLKGQWDLSILRQYRLDLDYAFGQLNSAGHVWGQCLTFVDLTYHGIQSKEIAVEWQRLIAYYAPGSKRTAVLMPQSALQAMQIKRISPLDDRRAFGKHDEDLALAWLFAVADTPLAGSSAHMQLKVDLDSNVSSKCEA